MIFTKQKMLFFGQISPLGGLCGIGLLIMASGRLSWAVSVSMALLCIYVFSVLAFVSLSCEKCRKFFPQWGRPYIFICISYLFAGIYILISWLASPLAAMEVFFMVLLIPLFCAGSGVSGHYLSSANGVSKNLLDSLREASVKAAAEAAMLAVLIILVSLIREPLAFYSLSLPSPSKGMIRIFSFEDGAVLPMRIFAGSAGALLLLGYIFCLYQYFKKKHFQQGDDK